MPKQQLINYWHNYILKRSIDDVLYTNHGLAYCPDSVFIHITIIDHYKNIFEAGWSMHSSLTSACGFLQHVFLPLAAFTWYDRQARQLYLPFADLHTVFKQLQNRTVIINNEMAELEAFLINLNQSYSAHALPQAIDRFNSSHQTTDQVISLQLYCGIHELKDALFSLIPFEEVFYEEMEMSKQDFSAMCDAIHSNPLVGKTIVKYLNAHIPIL